MEADIIRNYILACQNKNDNIGIEDFELEDNISMEKTTKELITVISLKDNPNLNLKVAHPSEYKITKHPILGTGIIAYNKNAYTILKENLKENEIIISIKK